MRLISAEILKLRKRRGLMIASLLMTVGLVVLIYGVILARYDGGSLRHASPGGVARLDDVLSVIAGFTLIVTVMIGATLGTGDESSGVFRDLVATGRSRSQLFLARLAGGACVLTPILLVTVALCTFASLVLPAGGDSLPSLSHIATKTGWLFGIELAYLTVALGVSALIGKRGVAIPVFLGFIFVVDPLLAALDSLGSLRRLLFGVAIGRLSSSGFGDTGGVSISSTTAVLVILGWCVAATALGNWRVNRREV